MWKVNFDFVAMPLLIVEIAAYPVNINVKVPFF
jgi:hypothetical protein